MRTTTVKAPPRKRGRVDDGYLALIRRFPLRPIRTAADYRAAVAMLDTLVLRDDLNAAEEDYLNVLTSLVEYYDRNHVDAVPSRRTPAERLRSVMESAGTTPAELQQVLGLAQSSVSMILSGKRGLSKPVIRKLADRFRLDPAYFL